MVNNTEERPVVSQPRDGLRLDADLLTAFRQHIEDGWTTDLLLIRLEPIGRAIEGDIEATAAGELLPYGNMRLEAKQREMEEGWLDDE